MQGNRLRPIGEDMPAFFGDGTAETPQPAPPPPPRPQQSVEQAATNMLMLALKALSQRAVVGVGHLFVVFSVASAWWLWMTTLPQPTTQQLVGLGLYGLLILSLNYLVLARTRSS